MRQLPPPVLYPLDARLHSKSVSEWLPRSHSVLLDDARGVAIHRNIVWMELLGCTSIEFTRREKATIQYS